MGVVKPGSLEWNRLITASKVAAILGLSPWESQRSVWHTMRGDVQRDEANEVQRRGHYLEPAILAWWRDQHDADTDPFHWRERPTYTLGDWAAATPDAQYEDRAVDRCLVEAKSAAYDDDWGDPGTDAIPDYYLVQVQWQLHVSGIRRCYVPVLTSRLRFVEYVVDYDEATGPLLEARMREFYDSLSADMPPPLDGSVATFQTMRKLHPDIERGESVELDQDAAGALVYAVENLKHWEGRDRLARSTVLDLMGRAQYATYDGARIARRQPRGDAVTIVVTGKPEDLVTIEEESA